MLLFQQKRQEYFKNSPGAVSRAPFCALFVHIKVVCLDPVLRKNFIMGNFFAGEKIDLVFIGIWTDENSLLESWSNFSAQFKLPRKGSYGSQEI